MLYGNCCDECVHRPTSTGPSICDSCVGSNFQKKVIPSYVIMGDDYEDTYIVGTCSSKESGEKYIREHQEELDKQYNRPHFGFTVEETEEII